MATLDVPHPDTIPEALVKVQETAIEQIRPTPEKIPKFVEDIRAVLQNQPAQMNNVSPSQDKKVALGGKLVQQVFLWCLEQDRTYRDQLQGLMGTRVKRQSIHACPLILPLAKYIQNSKIKDAVEWEMTYKTEYVKPRNFGVTILDYETRQVPYLLKTWGVFRRVDDSGTCLLRELSLGAPQHPLA
jgi:hypothetical protein